MKSMKLNYISGFVLIVVIIFSYSSCNEDFLVRLPKDQISEAQYWSTDNDLRLYLNQLYPPVFNEGNTWYWGSWADDKDCDNLCSIRYLPTIWAGTRTIPATDATWTGFYSRIRIINYFLENYQNVKLPFDSYKHYVGEAYFFRGYEYYRLVRLYGDVPYISKTLGVDSEELYASRTPRQQVVDSIIVDMDKAIDYMQSQPNEGGMRLNKGIAQLIKSQICLFEGTWEKYHAGTTFGVSNPNPNKYLQLAVQAALDLINSGVYSLYTTGNPKEDFKNLFNQINYDNHSEVMFWEKYSRELNKMHFHQYCANQFNRGLGITKSCVDDFLCSDGLPKAVSTLYQGDETLVKVMTNRDPRLNATVFEPGDPYSISPYPNGDTTWVFDKSYLDKPANYQCCTGYAIQKGYRPDPDQFLATGYGLVNYTGRTKMRFAEAFLNYAEAKAELGTINQADIDLSINRLRDRVGMPHLNIGNITTDPDWLFPTLSPIINEIRRERRVETVCESLRMWDLFRWRAHELIVGKRPLGINFDPVMYPTLVVGKSVYLNNEGYVDPYQKAYPNGYNFNHERDYLYPIGSQELTLNENMIQNPGWNP
jgi:hypothetical protein